MLRRPRHSPRVEFALLSGGLVGIALLLVLTDWLSDLDGLIYDVQMRLWPQAVPEDVVIVAIDERSLTELGRWPWPRSRHARLIETLSAAGARTIGLDIIFAEPDHRHPEEDAALARALRQSARVILPVVPERARPGGPLKETLPIPMLHQAAAGLGHTDLELDRDGVLRSAYLLAGMGRPHWPQFALAMLQQAEPGRWRDPPGERYPRLDQTSPGSWLRDRRVLLPFVGPPGSLRQVSYADVLAGRLAPDTFRDRLVLVGASAAGLGDAFPTPVSGFSRAMPGVEVLANLLDALRGHRTIQPLALPWRVLLTGLLVGLVLVLDQRLGPRWSLPATLGLVLLTLVLSAVLLRTLQSWFPPSAALLGLGISYPLWSWRRLQGALRSLAEQKERIQVTLDAIGDGVISTDAQGVVRYLNPVAHTLVGSQSGKTCGEAAHALFRIVDETTGEELPDPFSQCLSTMRRIAYPEHSLLVNRRGDQYPIHGSVSPILDHGGQVLGAVLAISDISQERRLTRQMAYQATHDALTQLPNRALLEDRLQHALAHAHRSARLAALFFIDLDRFKNVNDALGHSAGDALLKAVAIRLKAACREEDTIVRLGGDEFVVLLENLHHEEQANIVAQKVLRSIKSPFRLDHHEFFITCSIGISLYPRDGQDPETLLKNADAAMYRAKETGRSNIQYYCQELNARALDRLIMERKLRFAASQGELELRYQPLYGTRDGRLVGAEALLRWSHPELGILAPSAFIPLAEDTDLVIEIGEWVLGAACRQARAWRDEGLPIPRVAINVSARQFMQPEFTDTMARVLEMTGLAGHHVELEITENTLMGNADQTIDTLHALKALGVHLAVDDFGTGYSSMSYLKQFPIDRLKIDRSFVQDVDSDPDNAAISQAIIAMAHSMHLKVVAEGVETQEQADYLRTQRCDEIQGYLFSRPLAAAELTAMLRTTHTPLGHTGPGLGGL